LVSSLASVTFLSLGSAAVEESSGCSRARARSIGSEGSSASAATAEEDDEEDDEDDEEDDEEDELLLLDSAGTTSLLLDDDEDDEEDEEEDELLLLDSAGTTSLLLDDDELLASVASVASVDLAASSLEVAAASTAGFVSSNGMLDDSINQVRRRTAAD